MTGEDTVSATFSSVSVGLYSGLREQHKQFSFDKGIKWNCLSIAEDLGSYSQLPLTDNEICPHMVRNVVLRVEARYVVLKSSITIVTFVVLH